MVIEIKKAEYQSSYKIKLTFSDNSERVIDFEKFLRNAKNPMTKKYLNLNKFRRFKVDYGDLLWGDFEMCFPIWDLHEEKIWG